MTVTGERVRLLDLLALDPERCVVIHPDGSTQPLGQLVHEDIWADQLHPSARCRHCGGANQLTLLRSGDFAHADPALCASNPTGRTTTT